MTPETRSQRLYPRVRPTNTQGAKAQIIVGPKAPAVACRLIDYSAGGACLGPIPTFVVVCGATFRTSESKGPWLTY